LAKVRQRLRGLELHAMTPTVNTEPRHCRHCGDDIPDDAPADVTSCRAYADWRARQAGDMLTDRQFADLTLYRGLCQLTLAFRHRLPTLPELEP
jgi:hypothetical protein